MRGAKSSTFSSSKFLGGTNGIATLITILKDEQKKQGRMKLLLMLIFKYFTEVNNIF